MELSPLENCNRPIAALLPRVFALAHAHAQHDGPRRKKNSSLWQSWLETRHVAIGMSIYRDTTLRVQTLPFCAAALSFHPLCHRRVSRENRIRCSRKSCSSDREESIKNSLADEEVSRAKKKSGLGTEHACMLRRRFSSLYINPVVEGHKKKEEEEEERLRSRTRKSSFEIVYKISPGNSFEKVSIAFFFLV